MDDSRKPSDVDSPASTFHSSQLGPDYQSDYHSQLAPEYYSVEISNIEMTQLPKVGWISLDDHFWLQIVAGDKMEETSVEGRGSLRWQHKFTFNVRKSSTLSFRLYARRYVHENKFIGKVEKRIETLVTHPDDIVFKGWYNPEHTDDLEHTSLICRIAKRKLSPEEAAMEAAKTELRISNIIVRHLPRIGLTSLDNRFFVQIEVDDKITSVTKVQRGHSLQWNNEYRCDYRKDSRIQLKVLAHRHVHSDQFVGAISDKVESLLQRGFIRQQISIGNEHQLPVSMEFQIAAHGSQPGDGKPNALDGGGLTHAVAPTLIVVEVSDICLTRLPKIGMVAFDDQFFVQLVVENIMETQTTSSKTQQDGSVFWDQKYVFNVPETALLSLQVCARRHIHSDEYIGMVSGPIGVFLQDSGCNDRQLVVFDKQSKSNQETKLSFRMTRSSSCYANEYGGSSVHSPSTQSRDCSPQQHVDDAVCAVIAMVSPTPKGGMQGDIEPLPAQAVQGAQVFVRDTSDTFQLLLSRITIFVRIARAFAEAHPYTKMALMVLTAGHEVIHRQLARDDRIQQLAFVMCESYGLISDTPDLRNFHSQAETINLLARQTIECAYFIRDYAVHKSGLKHAVANVFSNIDASIQNYETAFIKIRTALEQQAVINTQLVVFRIHDVLKDLATKENLKALPYTTGTAYHAQRSCGMPPEENHVNEVLRWVNDKDGPAIYLLIGPHGSENSAVAHAVARQFDNISRLGSSYCFGRTCQRRPANLFSTIARDLADHDPEFMACLGNKVKRRSIGSSPHIPTQFDFILAPAQQLTSFGPVLVVIDALDACVDSLAEVVSVLKEKAQFLPSSFKFLITCLPETDVAITLRDQPHVLSKELDAVDTGQFHDNGFIAGRIKPRPLTPPIQTALPQPDYFSSSGSAVSVASSSSVSSFAPSIFDEGLRTFSLDASSPASSVTSCTDAGPPKRIVSTLKHTETKENCILFDQSGVPQTVTHTITKQTVKQHVTSTPRRVPSYAPMLDMPNAPLFTSDPTALAGDTFGAVPAQCDSPRPPRHKRTPKNRQETIIRHEMQTTGPQPIPLLSL